MTDYLSSHEPDFREPDHSASSHRFALGSASKASSGAPPLFAIGMNPSHAAETQADRTVRVVWTDFGCVEDRERLYSAVLALDG